MRLRLFLFVTAAFLAISVPIAGAVDAPIGETTRDILAPSDEIVTVDFPRDTRGFSVTETAAYSDPLGLIDYYQFTSLYTQGTDRIAVYTCPAFGPVTSTTAAQAVAVANGEIKEQFASLSEGAYNVTFEIGGDIPAGSGGTNQDCQNYAANNFPPGVNGVMFVENISGGYAGPGSTCAPDGYCSPTWPFNSRAGFVTSGGFMTTVWTHEHGHMITWPHSGSGVAASSAYDNPMGLMSGNARSNGSTNALPYETNVANRLAAGWIKPAETLIYDGSDTTVDLGTAGVSGTQMIAIPAGPDAFWSIGARKSDANDPFPTEWSGVEVMYIENCGQKCYPLSRDHTTLGQTPWFGGDGKPVHMISVGQIASVAGYDLQVLSGDSDSFQIRLSDPNTVVPGDDVVRLAGADRYATSAVVSAEIFTNPSAVSSVFIATGSNFPDALGAAAAAGHLGAPVLLVGDNVPGTVAAELVRLNPQTIYVVGGTSVVTNAVASQLGAYGQVKRLAGGDRYATSAAVSAEVFPNASTVFIATGSNFPDALGAAAAAGFVGSPVLLVGDTVSAPVAAELARLNPSKIYVVGGTSVVSNFVVGQLGAYGNVERIAGNDRYGTSAQVSRKIFADASAVSSIFVATGTNFPDALGAAAAAGHVGSPVLLVSDTMVPASVASEIARLNPTTKYLVGGLSVIPNTVASQL